MGRPTFSHGGEELDWLQGEHKRLQEKYEVMKADRNTLYGEVGRLTDEVEKAAGRIAELQERHQISLMQAVKIVRLKKENAALAAVVCPMDMAVGDESGNVICNLPNVFNDEGCQYKCLVVDRLKAEVEEQAERWAERERKALLQASDLKARVQELEGGSDE